jgi:hypothetical protein
VILLTTLVGRVHKHVKIAAVFANLEGDKANTRCFIAVTFLKAVIYQRLHVDLLSELMHSRSVSLPYIFCLGVAQPECARPVIG